MGVRVKIIETNFITGTAMSTYKDYPKAACFDVLPSTDGTMAHLLLYNEREALMVACPSGTWMLAEAYENGEKDAEV